VHLRAALRYDADPARVAAMMADVAFVEDKLRRSGALDQHAEVVGDPRTGFTVTARRRMPTDAIPAQFRSFVGSTLEVRHVEAWEPPADGERRGSVVVEIVGAPVRFTGRLRLGPTAEGAEVLVDGDLKASVPFVAAAIEEAAAGAVQAALDAEEEAGRAWLAGNPG